MEVSLQMYSQANLSDTPSLMEPAFSVTLPEDILVWELLHRVTSAKSIKPHLIVVTTPLGLEKWRLDGSQWGREDA